MRKGWCAGCTWTSNIEWIADQCCNDRRSCPCKWDGCCVLHQLGAYPCKNLAMHAIRACDRGRPVLTGADITLCVRGFVLEQHCLHLAGRVSCSCKCYQEHLHHQANRPQPSCWYVHLTTKFCSTSGHMSAGSLCYVPKCPSVVCVHCIASMNQQHSSMRHRIFAEVILWV
jgi:hypothetical protein